MRGRIDCQHLQFVQFSTLFFLIHVVFTKIRVLSYIVHVSALLICSFPPYGGSDVNSYHLRCTRLQTRNEFVTSEDILCEGIMKYICVNYVHSKVTSTKYVNIPTVPLIYFTSPMIDTFPISPPPFEFQDQDRTILCYADPNGALVQCPPHCLGLVSFYTFLDFFIPVGS